MLNIFQLQTYHHITTRYVIVPNFLIYDTLNKICSSTDSCLIYGNFNLTGIDWIASTISTMRNICNNKFLSYGLTQLINFNTRNSNILDLNNTLNVSNISSTSALAFDAHVSDYYAIYSDLLIPDNSVILIKINVESCDLTIIKVILLVFKLIFCNSTGQIFTKCSRQLKNIFYLII